MRYFVHPTIAAFIVIRFRDMDGSVCDKHVCIDMFPLMYNWAQRVFRMYDEHLYCVWDYTWGMKISIIIIDRDKKDRCLVLYR